MLLPKTERSGPIGQECPSLGMKTARPSVLQSSLLSAASDPNILSIQQSARSWSHGTDMLSGNCKEQESHPLDEEQ